MYPSPPPGLCGPRGSAAGPGPMRIGARSTAKMAFWLKSHPYNDMLGNGLPEDERTWAFDFRVMTPTAWWRVPFGMNIGGLPDRCRSRSTASTR